MLSIVVHEDGFYLERVFIPIFWLKYLFVVYLVSDQDKFIVAIITETELFYLIQSGE